MTCLSTDRYVLHRMDSLESTQDETRRLLRDHDDKKQVLAVTCDEQTKGRGTSGRQWIGTKGNVFLTVAIPAQKVPVMITLLPLQVGTIVANTISKLLVDCGAPSESKVTLKWPNDVLVNQRKISGVLIESELLEGDSWFLIGIGVNLVHAPDVPTSGPNRGRPSTSVQNLCHQAAGNDQMEENESKSTMEGMDASAVAAEITSELVDFVHQDLPKDVLSREVIAGWKKWAEFGKQQVLRDVEGNEIVVPIGIEADGQLRVRGQDGQERLLVADYLL
eukprot:CAMPEP_0195304426 /NCGR_PEP_ID=MMETSP0707-20130614/34413_1 /TAXON_ID=33640 /ORGANISM="Asterionellopsis glacialis, Strain CCMP134" /LENGTH=276 /DNA_ID=CAMNT_0040368221 /DNA_START=253 /DNA_END=1083 /DNA_ORIENTATION=+